MNINQQIEKQRAFYKTNITKNYEYRIKALQQLKHGIKQNEVAIMEALKEDLNKSEHEAYLSEIALVYSEINYFTKNLKKLMKPKKVKQSLSTFPNTGKIYSEPKGLVLVISPWNYPFQLCIIPLIDAIAAGNCVAIKPSELAPKTSQIIETIITQFLDANHCCVFSGGKLVSEELLTNKFDHIIFTGGEVVGRIVLESAAKTLTPTTLELGGKSPVIVEASADIKLAAKKIAFGKFLNAGQTCVAPDYLLVDATIKDALITNICEYITEFYHGNALECEYYPKIINEKHLERLKSYLIGQHIVYGGQSNETQMAPTIIDDVFGEEEVMREEIFGPILPIMTYNHINEAFDFISSRPHPLALYIFSSNQAIIDRVISELSFGGGCVNNTIMHLANHHLPFGGIGSSGLGAYHGVHGFNTLSHQKSVLTNHKGFDFSFKYPPFNKKKLALIKMLMK